MSSTLTNFSLNLNEPLSVFTDLITLTEVYGSFFFPLALSPKVCVLAIFYFSNYQDYKNNELEPISKIISYYYSQTFTGKSFMYSQLTGR